MHRLHVVLGVPPVSTGSHVSKRERFVTRKMRGDLAGHEVLAPQWTLVVEEDSARNPYAISSSIDAAPKMAGQLGDGIGRPRRKVTRLSKSSSATVHLRRRSLIQANRSRSDSFKYPYDSQIVKLRRVSRAVKGLPNMGLSGEVINLIRLYSFDGSFDGLVFEELQRDSLDGLRKYSLATATITTKDTITQPKKVFGKIVSVLACRPSNQGSHLLIESIGAIPFPTTKFHG